MSDKIPTTNHDTLYTLYGLRATDMPIINRHSSAVDDLVQYFSKYLNERNFPSDFEAKLEQAKAAKAKAAQENATASNQTSP